MGSPRHTGTPFSSLEGAEMAPTVVHHHKLKVLGEGAARLNSPVADPVHVEIYSDEHEAPAQVLPKKTRSSCSKILNILKNEVVAAPAAGFGLTALGDLFIPAIPYVGPALAKANDVLFDGMHTLAAGVAGTVGSQLDVGMRTYTTKEKLLNAAWGGASYVIAASFVTMLNEHVLKPYGYTSYATDPMQQVGEQVFVSTATAKLAQGLRFLGKFAQQKSRAHDEAIEKLNQDYTPGLQR